MWGGGEGNWGCKREGQSIWQSSNVYVSIHVAFLRRCAGYLDRNEDERIRQVLHVGMKMALCCQKDERERVYYICGVFLDTRLSIGYVNGAGYIQEILKTQPNKSRVAKQYRGQGLSRWWFTSKPLVYWKSVCEPSWCRLFATVIVACDWDMRFSWWWRLRMHAGEQLDWGVFKLHYRPTCFNMI